MDNFTLQLNLIEEEIDKIQTKVASLPDPSENLLDGNFDNLKADLTSQHMARQQIIDCKEKLKLMLSESYRNNFSNEYKCKVLRLLLRVENMLGYRFAHLENPFSDITLPTHDYKLYCEMALRINPTNSYFLARFGSIHKII